MENKNYLAIAAILVAVLVGGLFLGSKIGGKGDTNISCTNGGASAGGSSPSLLSNGGSQPSGSDLKFGAVSGTEYATVPNFTTVSTTGSFLGQSTVTWGVNAGTIATSTFSGTTSTISFSRLCFIGRSPTGTQTFATFQNGQFVSQLNSCQ